MAKSRRNTKSKIKASATKQVSKNQEPNVEWKFPLKKQNFMILGIGLAVILVAYGLMSSGISDQPAVPDGDWNNFWAVTVAPIMLVIGYCVIIPFGLLKYFGDKTEEPSTSEA